MITSRWATVSGPRSPTGWPFILGGVADEVSVARVDSYDVLELVTSGDPYTMDQKTQDARGEESALGARDQFGDQCVDWRACRDALVG